MRQRLITSCSGSASLFPLRSSAHPENGRKPYAGPPFRRQTLHIFRHPGDHTVQVRNRRVGRVLVPLPFSSKPLP